MISLSTHATALSNLGVTLRALDDLTKLITYYSPDPGKDWASGPAYFRVENGPSSGSLHNMQVQVDRKLAVEMLTAQRQKLVDYLATLGVDANS